MTVILLHVCKNVSLYLHGLKRGSEKEVLSPIFHPFIPFLVFHPTLCQRGSLVVDHSLRVWEAWVQFPAESNQIFQIGS